MKACLHEFNVFIEVKSGCYKPKLEVLLIIFQANNNNINV